MKIDKPTRFILDSVFEGILIADDQHIVRYINPSYKRITGVTNEDILGKKVDEVRPGARLPHVIDTGEELLNTPRKEGNMEYLVNMRPLKLNDEIVGGISTLNEMENIYDIFEDLKKSEFMIKQLEDHMRKISSSKYSFDDIIAKDEKSIETKQLAKRVAKADSNVLITGETGTGKELYAHSIHYSSNRRDGSFVAINSASFDKRLMESELFGYEEGAFTGAKKGGKVGLFEVADGGTLFLDEIGEMELSLQAKLLRVLEEGKIRRIGGLEEIDVDVRIIAATNRDLSKMIKDGNFREDLYYRLSVFPIQVLPLRERKKDIKYLVNFTLNEYADKMKRSLEISETALTMMINYSWPGNVRELKNAIEFAANMTDDYIIEKEHLPERIRVESIKENIIELEPLELVVRETEKKAIKKAIKIYGDTVEGKKKAAKSLDISLATLYNKLKEDDF